MDGLQSKLLEILKWFHEFCVKNSLQYYVLGGTMLGAARHQGFIPWDDDIDVGLPRPDYERLKRLLADSDGRYFLETPRSAAKEFCYVYCKLYDTTTTYIDNRRYQVKRGAFLDIFPLDGLGASKKDAKKNYKPIRRKYDFILTRTTRVRKGRKWYKNLAILFSKCIPSFLIDDKKLFNELDEMCASRDYYNYEWGGNLIGAYGFHETMPRSIMGNPTLYRFEDIEVFGAEDFDGYLTRLYGEWRKLPPKEKQVTHHDCVEIDLNKSYLS